MVVEFRLPRPRPLQLALIAVGGLSLLVMLRLMHDVLGTLRTDDARLVVPAVPVVPAAQPVVAQEYGRLGRLFVREGAAVAPGEPLFSLQRDPGIDQELADRGVARDLAELNEQIRDTRRVIDSLSERIVMARPVRQSLLEQQIALAHQRLLRREQLWREGGVSRDLLDEAGERLLKLRQELLEQQRDHRRLLELQRLQRSQQQRWWRLSERQALVRQLDLQRRAAARRHPRLASEEQARLDYATYQAPGRGVLLRLLKQPGDPVRPRETVAIWQREQPPPQVEARLPAQGGRWLMATDQLAKVEIPSLRQAYSARLLSWRPGGAGLLLLRLDLEGVPPVEVRRLLSLPGEPVRVELARRFNLIQWLQTGQLASPAAP